MRKLLNGRYGPDHLGVALIILSFLISLLYAILGYMLVLFLSYFIFATVLFRMFSYNTRRRQKENDKFIRYWWPIRTRVLRIIERMKKLFKRK